MLLGAARNRAPKQPFVPGQLGTLPAPASGPECSPTRTAEQQQQHLAACSACSSAATPALPSALPSAANRGSGTRQPTHTAAGEGRRCSQAPETGRSEALQGMHKVPRTPNSGLPPCGKQQGKASMLAPHTAQSTQPQHRAVPAQPSGQWPRPHIHLDLAPLLHIHRMV